MIEGDRNGERLPASEIERQKLELKAVVQYCQNVTDCRRALVLQYFGEDFSPANCKENCNNCSANKDGILEDMSSPAQAALRLAKEILRDGRNTINYISSVFRGSQRKEIKERGHSSLPDAGAGSSLGPDQVDRLFSHLLSKDALVQKSHPNASGFHNTYVAVRCAVRSLRRI